MSGQINAIYPKKDLGMKIKSQPLQVTEFVAYCMQLITEKMIDLNVCSKLCEWKIYTLQMEAVSKRHLITDRVMIRQEPH